MSLDVHHETVDPSLSAPSHRSMRHVAISLQKSRAIPAKVDEEATTRRDEKLSHFHDSGHSAGSTVASTPPLMDRDKFEKSGTQTEVEDCVTTSMIFPDDRFFGTVSPSDSACSSVCPIPGGYAAVKCASTSLGERFKEKGAPTVIPAAGIAVTVEEENGITVADDMNTTECWGKRESEEAESSSWGNAASSKENMGTSRRADLDAVECDGVHGPATESGLDVDDWLGVLDVLTRQNW